MGRMMFEGRKEAEGYGHNVAVPQETTGVVGAVWGAGVHSSARAVKYNEGQECSERLNIFEERLCAGC